MVRIAPQLDSIDLARILNEMTAARRLTWLHSVHALTGRLLPLQAMLGRQDLVKKVGQPEKRFQSRGSRAPKGQKVYSSQRTQIISTQRQRDEGFDKMSKSRQRGRCIYLKNVFFHWKLFSKVNHVLL